MAYSDIDSNKVLNKEGLLELCSQIKTEIANNSGNGGSTYTAGKNITIDANNTINAQPEISAWILQSLLYAGTPFENEVVELNSSNSTTDFINALQAGKLIYISSSVSWSGLGTTLANLGYTKYIKIPQITLNSFGYTTYNLTLTNQQNWKPEQPYYYQAYENTIFGAPGGGLAKWLRYYSTNSGLSAGTIWGAIDELAGNVATKLTAPTAPTTDGQYKLTSTITSGASTYSWEADTGSTYTLPTASTNTLGGVKVDGSTITISDGVISAASSGGASYTAGTGINIDANNTISLLDNRTSLVPIIYSIITRNSGMVRQESSIQALWNNRFSRVNLTYHIDNLKTWRMTYFSDGLTVATWRSLVEALEGPIEDLNTQVPYRFPSTSQADQYTYIMAQTTASLANNSRFNMANQPVLVEYVPDATTKWIFISYPERLFQNVYFNSQKGLTSHSIAAAIDEVATRIPAAPTTDGDYVLKVSVSSGTPTYSWVSVS